MSDQVNLLAAILVLYVLAALYALSRPAWLVRLWEQIARPFQWIERKLRRTP